MAALRKLLLAPWVLVPALLVLAVALYAAFGFWGVPRIIRSQTDAYVRDTLHRELRLGEITFNPFTFRLTIRDAMILERGTPLVGMGYLLADYRPQSFFTREHVLRGIVVDRPYARVILERNGALNLADLLPKTTGNVQLPSALIADLAISDGRVDFTDRRAHGAPHKVFAPISFHLQGLHTTGDAGNARLQARSEDGETLAWQGQVSLTPVASNGHFRLAGLRSKTINDFLGALLPFRLSSGRVDASGDYTFALPGKGGMQLDARLPEIDTKDLRLRARGAEADWVIVPSAHVSNMQFSLAHRKVDIDTLRADGVLATVWLEPGGELNLRRLFTGQVVREVKAAPGGAWRVAIAHARLAGANVALEDRTVHPVARFVLSPVTATADRVSLDTARAIPVKVAATIDGTAPLVLEGDVVPAPLSADLRVEVSGMPVGHLHTYLPDYPTLQLRSGEVGARGHLVLHPADAPGPRLEYHGDADIARVDMFDKVNKGPLVGWERLDARGIDFAATPIRVAIRSVSIRRPVARIVIAPSGRIKLVAKTLEAPTPETVLAHATAAKTPSTLPAFRIGEVRLEDASMLFADFSIQPNFRAKVDALHGRVTNVSNAPGTTSQIELAGHVINQYSPVTIKGYANLFKYDERTDVAMQFRNIELPVFNPYSGKWAGYSITKGKLTTNLEYKIDHRRLVADHHIVIDQLEWGEATGSKEKVSLPIRLASSLLKDSNGTITLDVPVSGSLDDPTFRLGPIIWQIVKNVVAKIVRAPFKLLASHFHGAEDAQYVDFAPGSSTLPDKAKGALPKLADSLAERPELSLDIPAGPLDPADKAALDDARFKAAIAEFRTGQPGAGTPYDALDDKARMYVLFDLYRREFGRSPDLQDAETLQAQQAGQRPSQPHVAEDAAAASVGADMSASDAVATSLPPPPATTSAPAIASTPPAEPTRRERKATQRSNEVEWLEAQLRPRFRADATAASDLVKTRAIAVQDALLANGKVAPERVFVDTTKSAQQNGDKVRMELALR